MKAGLAAPTINDTVADICCMLKGTGQDVPIVGRRLVEKAPEADQPNLHELGQLYSAASQAEWPLRYGIQDTTAWWRAFICLSYHWPFRLGDLLCLTTKNLHDSPGETYPRVEVVAGRKTGATYTYPLTDLCRRHLTQLLRIEVRPCGTPANGSLFMLKMGSMPYVRDELTRLCKIAGIKKCTSQSIRRASLSSYACLGNDCGALAHHGTSGLGVRQHYVSMIRVLSQSIDRFDVPDAMLDPKDKAKNDEQLKRLVMIARKMPSDDIKRLVRTAEAW